MTAVNQEIAAVIFFVIQKVVQNIIYSIYSCDPITCSASKRIIKNKFHMKCEDGVYIQSTLEEGYDFHIVDKYKRKYHFKISSFHVPTGLVSEALEVVEEGKGLEPNIFHILSDHDEDVEYAEMLLKAKIKKEINKRYLKMRDGKLTIKGLQGMGGRIYCTDNNLDTAFDHILVVDGKRVTVENFAEMIKMFGGFNFRLTFHDLSDDIPD